MFTEKELYLIKESLSDEIIILKNSVDLYVKTGNINEAVFYIDVLNDYKKLYKKIKKLLDK